jgi:hypothetical protein
VGTGRPLYETAITYPPESVRKPTIINVSVDRREMEGSPAQRALAK